MMAVLNDTNNFFDSLLCDYNIRMFQQSSNRKEIVYLGEFFSYRGERFIISVIVAQGKTKIQVFNMTGNKKTCVFQKVYSTVNDKNSLSKSTSLHKFLNSTLYN